MKLQLQFYLKTHKETNTEKAKWLHISRWWAVD